MTEFAQSSARQPGLHRPPRGYCWHPGWCLRHTGEEAALGSCHAAGKATSPAQLWDGGVLAAHPAPRREQWRSDLGRSAAPPPSASPASPAILPEVHQERGGRRYWLDVH